MKFETEVTDSIKRTQDVISVRFSCPSSFDYKAGHYVFITLSNEEEEVRKHFSLSSSPSEKDFIEITKRLTGSQFSNAFNSLKVGDEVKIDGPYGSFVFEETTEKMGMLSGGIGITPLRSMCKYASDLKLKTDIILLYGNENLDNIIFRDELKQLSKKNEALKIVHTLNNPPSEWDGYTGYINIEMIKKEIPDYKERVFYTCGPPAMVKAMKNLLQELNVSKEQINVENFPGY